MLFLSWPNLVPEEGSLNMLLQGGILFDDKNEEAMDFAERATDFRPDFVLFPEIAQDITEREDRIGSRAAEGSNGPGLSPGLGPDEASLALMADEIILEAAMGHIERLAEVVMQEEYGGPSHPESPSPSISFSAWAKGMKEKLGPERGKVIDEAKNEVMEFFVKAYKELGQLKYEEMEPQLLEKAAVMFDNKISEAERSPITPSSGRIDGLEGKGSSSKIEMPRKKAFDVEEWAIELNKIWEEDEEMWNVMDDMFEELKKNLESHGGINKYDIVGAREAAKILRRKIESSSLKEKYGPTSSLGRGLKNQISTGYMLCKWAGDYYDNSDEIPQGEWSESANEDRGEWTRSDLAQTVRISTSEWETLAEIERKTTLIGRFGRDRPSIGLIRAEVQSSLHTREVRVGSLDARTILLRFAAEEDCEGAEVVPENLNIEETTPTICRNGNMIVEDLNANGCPPSACEKVFVGDEEPITEGLETEALSGKQGLENKETDLATPSNIIRGVKENGGGSASRLREMVHELRAKGIDISIVSKESDERFIGSNSSLSYNTWAKRMKEKWGPERGKLIDEAKQEVLTYFEKAFKDLGQSKYDELEPQLLEGAGSIFESKLKEAESNVEQAAVKGKVQEGEVCTTGSGNRKKEWELHEWALLLKEKWIQDEDLGDIIESSLEEIRAYLRNNHGGWLEKFDAKAASEASSILKCKIEASSIVKKYGPKSRLGWGLKCKHLSTGYFLCDRARKYFDGVIESEGSGSSEESDEEGAEWYAAVIIKHGCCLFGCCCVLKLSLMLVELLLFWISSRRVQRWDQTGMLMPWLIYHGNEQFMTRKAISRSSAAGSFLVFRLEWMQLHFCSPCCHNGFEGLITCCG
nr:TMV resistance protein N-like [Ipomoea batatas]